MAEVKSTKASNGSSSSSSSSRTGNHHASSSSPSSTPALDRKAIFYMILLAVQFGIQPILTQRYTPRNIISSTVIFTQEIVKFIIAYTMLRLSGATSTAIQGWTVNKWLSVALLPAGLYAIQNMAALMAYQNLDALTYNTLNQTKTLSAALCCYIVMGRPQSTIQILSLLLLLLSALVMEGIVSVYQVRTMFSVISLKQQTTTTLADDDASTSSSWQSRLDGRHFTHGVAPILLASFISGLAGALSQKNLQQQQQQGSSSSGGRNAYLFSMELCAATCVILGISLCISTDGTLIRQHGFWYGWNASTMIPICTNSAGGIIVGLVTKYAGSVRKGFALIFGIFLSGVIQALLQPDMHITPDHIAGGILAAIATYLHAAHPPTTTKPKSD